MATPVYYTESNMCIIGINVLLQVDDLHIMKGHFHLYLQMAY